MNALLIYPKFPDTFWSFSYALKFIRKKSAYPPLGLLTVGAMLPKEWSVRLIDVNIEELKEKDLLWADYVFISAMAVQRKSVEEIISRCNDINSKKGNCIKIVAGGPLFTCEPELFSEIDHLILNEAELTFPSFLADFEKKQAKRVYETPIFANIFKAPIPRWDLIDLKHYATMSIQFSRGCPYNCDFCNVTTLLGHKVRIKTAEQIIVELEELYKRGWCGSVFFVDDNFIGNRKYLLAKLLPALIKWRKGKKGFLFNTEASIDLVDNEKLMQMMGEAGFDTVFIGIETPAKEGLIECNKMQNKSRDLIESVKRIQRAGLQVQGGFIVGFDSDQPSIFQRQIEFIQKSGIVTAMVGLLQAPPGTKLYERMESQGRLGGRISGDNVDGSTNIKPIMGLNNLLLGYEKILKKIYSPKVYYQRIIIFLKEYKAPKFKLPNSWQRLMAGVRSSYRLGVFGKERMQYWKLLLWTLINCPRLLPLAITLAIHGYHFRKITEIEKRKN